MKAILHTKHGPPDELQLKEVDKLVPEEYEVLIKIFATNYRVRPLKLKIYSS
jgi:NADPH:quinone reductase-like Zn-dependent oxidoreductase